MFLYPPVRYGGLDNIRGLRQLMFKANSLQRGIAWGEPLRKERLPLVSMVLVRQSHRSTNLLESHLNEDGY